MDQVTPTHLWLAVLSSSALGALLTQVFGLLRDRWTTKRTAEQAQVARRVAAHEAARDSFVQKAGVVRDWLTDIEWEINGSDRGVYRPEHRHQNAVGRHEDAIALLTTIQLEHPTREIRDRAGQLHEKLTNHYCEPHPEGYIPEPKGDIVMAWVKEAAELVEAIHVPA